MTVTFFYAAQVRAVAAGGVSISDRVGVAMAARRRLAGVALVSSACIATLVMSTTLASAGVGFYAARVYDPISVSETFGAPGDPVQARARVDASGLGVRPEQRVWAVSPPLQPRRQGEPR